MDSKNQIQDEGRQQRKKHSKVALDLWEPSGLNPIIDKDYRRKSSHCLFRQQPEQKQQREQHQHSSRRVASVFQIDKPAEEKKQGAGSVSNAGDPRNCFSISGMNSENQ